MKSSSRLPQFHVIDLVQSSVIWTLFMANTTKRTIDALFCRFHSKKRANFNKIWLSTTVVQMSPRGVVCAAKHNWNWKFNPHKNVMEKNWPLKALSYSWKPFATINILSFDTIYTILQSYLGLAPDSRHRIKASNNRQLECTMAFSPPPLPPFSNVRLAGHIHSQ